MSDIERDRERLPESNYRAEYPHNQVEVTSGGHEFHVDNTPGARRLRTSHSSGSYDEISENGRRVSVTVGTNHEYHKGGSTVTSDGNSDIRYNGHARVTAKSGVHSEVGGDASLAFGKALTVYASGKIKIGGLEIYIGASGDIEINAESGTLNLIGKKVNIHGETVSISGMTYLGQSSKGGTSGKPVEVITDIPAQRTIAE